MAAANASRAYGDPNPLFAGTITGIKNSDNITATYASAALVTSPVGTFIIVPTLVDPTAKLTQLHRDLQQRHAHGWPGSIDGGWSQLEPPLWRSKSAPYGTITGIKNGDNITATFATTALVTSPVGTFSIVPTLVDPSTKLGNYTVTSLNGTLTITQAPLTVAGANASRIYGDANPSFTGTVSGLKNADNITATFASAALVTSPVGTFAIVPTLVDPTAKLGNYSVTSNNGTLTITQAPLSVVAGDATRVYGDPNPTFVGTITGLKNGDNITATISGAGADPTSPVGTYALVPALVDPTGKLGNYSVTSTNGVLTITKAPLSVTTTNASRAYGDPNPPFTGTIAGIKNADNITATFTTTATPLSSVGTFAIVPALNDPTTKARQLHWSRSNNGTLTVNPALLTVTGTSASRLYGDANPVFTGTIVGVKNADGITATFSSAALISSPVGAFPIIPALIDPNLKLSNYTVNLINGTLTVNPAPLTVAGTDASRLYGDPNPAFTGTLSGVKLLITSLPRSPALL